MMPQLSDIWRSVVLFWGQWYGKLAVIIPMVVGAGKFLSWFREYRNKGKQSRLLDSQIKAAELTGPELSLHYENLGSDGVLVFSLTNAISARNVQLQKIETQKSIAEPLEIIPFLVGGQPFKLRLKTRTKDRAANGTNRLPLEAFLMESCDEPIVLTVIYEDPNGKRFVSKFDVTYDERTFSARIRQRERSLNSN